MGEALITYWPILAFLFLQTAAGAGWASKVGSELRHVSNSLDRLATSHKARLEELEKRVRELEIAEARRP